MAGFEHYAWLMKSEPSEVSVDDVLGMKDCKVGWFGVRNYQGPAISCAIFARSEIRSFSTTLRVLSPASSVLVKLPPNLIRIRRSLMKLQNISTRRVLRRSPLGSSRCAYSS